MCPRTGVNCRLKGNIIRGLRGLGNLDNLINEVGESFYTEDRHSFIFFFFVVVIFQDHEIIETRRRTEILILTGSFVTILWPHYSSEQNVVLMRA